MDEDRIAIMLNCKKQLVKLLSTSELSNYEPNPVLDLVFAGYVKELEYQVNRFTLRKKLFDCVDIRIIDLYCSILLIGFGQREISIDGRNQHTYDRVQRLNNGRYLTMTEYNPMAVLKDSRSVVCRMHHTLQQSCMRLFAKYCENRTRTGIRFRSNVNNGLCNMLAQGGFPLI